MTPARLFATLGLFATVGLLGGCGLFGTAGSATGPTYAPLTAGTNPVLTFAEGLVAEVDPAVDTAMQAGPPVTVVLTTGSGEGMSMPPVSGDLPVDAVKTGPFRVIKLALLAAIGKQMVVVQDYPTQPLIAVRIADQAMLDKIVHSGLVVSVQPNRTNLTN